MTRPDQRLQPSVRANSRRTDDGSRCTLCGHLLLGVVPLQKRPLAALCPTCATLQLELV
jgi:hypothetical protein